MKTLNKKTILWLITTICELYRIMMDPRKVYSFSEYYKSDWKQKIIAYNNFLNNPDLILTKTKQRPAPEIRAIIFRIIKLFYPNVNTSEMGMLLGGLDHSTVCYNINVMFEKLSATNKSYKLIYDKSRRLFEDYINPIKVEFNDCEEIDNVLNELNISEDLLTIYDK